MTGNNGTRFVIQDRDRHLLRELAVMRLIDRETSKLVAGFKSTRRANARLLQLTRAGYLKRFFVGSIAHGRKAVYTLSTKGSDLIQSEIGGIKRGSNRLLVGDRFVEHQEGINQVYVTLKYCSEPGVRMVRWLVFRQAISEAIKLAPDGYFEIAAAGSVRAAFLEVDLTTEALSIWKQKIASYIQLAVSGEFTRRFQQTQFRVLVIANSEQRVKNLRATVLKSTDKIFWFTTFQNIHRHGFWSAHWLRPSGDQPLPLS